MSVENDASSRLTLVDLPVELLAELYLTALTPSFPHTCRYIYAAVKSFSPSVHAYYIMGRHQPSVYYSNSKDEPDCIGGSYLTRALRYPICTIRVLEAMFRIFMHTSVAVAHTSGVENVELPKRLFRSLGESNATLGADSEPLPLLQFLWEKRPRLDFFKPMPNSHNGYPLVRAVHAGFMSLIRFLLDHGADPGKRGCMAVKIAIMKKDLALVKMLVEFEPEKLAATKKRRRVDRVAVEPSLLDLAVKFDARDIVQYFIQEKGCVPRMKTLKGI